MYTCSDYTHVRRTVRKISRVTLINSFWKRITQFCRGYFSHVLPIQVLFNSIFGIFFEIEKNGRVIKPYNEQSPRNLHRIESFTRFVTNTRRLVLRWRVRFFRIEIFGGNGVSVSGARFKCVFRSTTYGPRSLGAKKHETRRQKCRIAFE